MSAKKDRKPASTGRKTSRKCPSAARKLRDQAILGMSMRGMTNEAIGEKVGLNRKRVGEILNGEELKEMARQGESRLAHLMDKSLVAVEESLDQQLDLTNRLKAALAVLKSLGVLRDRVDSPMDLPQPTIIQRRDGTEIILGATWTGSPKVNSDD